MNLVELLKKNPPVPSNDITINTRIRYARNLEEFPFPIAINKEDALQVWQRVTEAIDGCEVFKDSTHFYLPELKRNERIFLIERRIISPDMLKTDLPSGAIVSADGKFNILVNEEDHLRIGILNYDIMETSIADDVSKLNEVENYLAQKLKFAFSKNNGYLTSCPTNLGCGMRISALFHLPALVLLKKIDKFLENIEKKGFLVRGYYGEKSRFYGDIFQIASGLCSCAEDTIQVMSKLFNKVENDETAALEEVISKKNKVRFSDIIYRSWGIIQTARLISFEETVSILSLLLFGKIIGLDDIDIDRKLIYELMMNTQPAHMQFIASREMNAAARDEFRAEYIREKIVAYRKQKMAKTH